MAKHYPHAWEKFKRLPWAYCRHCGLLWLKNEKSYRAAKASCPSTED